MLCCNYPLLLFHIFLSIFSSVCDKCGCWLCFLFDKSSFHVKSFLFSCCYLAGSLIMEDSSDSSSLSSDHDSQPLPAREKRFFFTNDHFTISDYVDDYGELNHVNKTKLLECGNWLVVRKNHAKCKYYVN